MVIDSKLSIVPRMFLERMLFSPNTSLLNSLLAIEYGFAFCCLIVEEIAFFNNSNSLISKRGFSNISSTSNIVLL